MDDQPRYEDGTRAPRGAPESTEGLLENHRKRNLIIGFVLLLVLLSNVFYDPNGLLPQWVYIAFAAVWAVMLLLYLVGATLRNEER